MATGDGQRPGRSFGSAAAAYARGRPGYPDEAVRWLVPSAAAVVLDLAAGTGAMTRSLANRSRAVVAVEASPHMLARMDVAGASRVAGLAEAIPLRDGCVDAVVVAQAWHWLDARSTCREVARVLRPGGTLGLVWNIRDERVDWVAELGRVMHANAEQDMQSVAPPIAPPFVAWERHDLAWSHTLTRERLLDLVVSRSYIISLAEAERRDVLRRVERLLDDHPDLAGRQTIALPYVTRCARAKLPRL